MIEKWYKLSCDTCKCWRIGEDRTELVNIADKDGWEINDPKGVHLCQKCLKKTKEADNE